MPRTRGNGSVVGQVITPGGSGVVAAQDATQYILSGQWPDSKYAPTSGASVTVSSIIVTDSGYNNLDDTAAATSNSYIKIIGSGFSSTANVFLNGTMVPKANITFVSSSELRAVLPVSNTGNYAISVFNSNTTGALYSNTFTISTMPQWLTSATLANVTSNTVFSNTLSATSDSSVTYSNTTILPTGMTLLSNGYYYGNISVGAETTYSFDVKATDAELQDSTKTFSLTVVTVIPYTVTYLSVAGGGGGGYAEPNLYGDGGGGGGAGGYVLSSASFNQGTTYTITIGSGGTGATTIPAERGASGSNTSITSPLGTIVTSIGGGGGGGGNETLAPGNSGGSGGGAGSGYSSTATGGSGFNFPGPTQQGYPGGSATNNPITPARTGGGGGGAGNSGTNNIPSSTSGGPGGAGLASSITGSSVTYAGGGGGGGGGAYPGGSGGLGGGGAGGTYNASAVNGTANRGGGGGGGSSRDSPGPGPINNGASGGSGVVILSMATSNYPGSAPGATVTTSGANTILTFNSSGTFTA